MKTVFLAIIRMYQLFASPIIKSLGTECRFYPSCSEYSRQAFIRHKWWKALFFSVRRVVRCNPYNSGGFDPVK